MKGDIAKLKEPQRHLRTVPWWTSTEGSTLLFESYTFTYCTVPRNLCNYIQCLLQCNVILQSIKYVWLSCKRLHPVIPNLYNLCHFYAMIHCIVAFHYVTPCMHKTGVPQPDLICLFLCLGLMLLLNI